ncbi:MULTISPECIES: LysR family transcriptional regulator [Acutalibacteraceae]|uniref:LysR substrate-binding domain-containing protein n=1 Tax=Acutalibacteraceae TaxID=3082771 RepID=UPI0013E8F213|nr:MULTISPECIES: LysR family transcriptional regulator [Acutalibacteraceae]
MFDSRQIEYVLAIAEEKSLTRAADKLYLTQSALSQQLAKLKIDGLPPLFEYRHGEMELTDAGKLYINGAHIIMKLKSDAMDLLQNSNHMPYAPVHISLCGLCDSIKYKFYEEAVPEFHKLFPDVVLNVQTHTTEAAEKLILNHKLDIAVFPARVSSSPEIDYKILKNEELVLILPANKELKDLPLLLPTPETIMHDFCINALTINSVERPVIFYIDEPETALDLVRQESCAAVISKSLFEAEPGIAIASWEKKYSYNIVAACISKKELSPPGQKMLELLNSVFL